MESRRTDYLDPNPKTLLPNPIPESLLFPHIQNNSYRGSDCRGNSPHRRFVYSIVADYISLMKTSDRLDEWPSTPIHHPDHNSDDLSEYLKRADIQKVTPTHKPSAKPSGDKDGRTGYEKFLSTLQNFHRRTRPPSYTVKTEEAM